MNKTKMADLQQAMKLMQQAVDAAEADYAKAKADRGLRSLPDGPRQLVEAARLSLREAQVAISAASGSIPELLADENIYPVGRTKAAKKKIEALAETVDRATTNAQQTLALARQSLLKEALPKLDRRRESAARQDALMALDRAPGDQKTAKFIELARRGDDVGALVNSSWGADYLRTIDGADDRFVQEIHGAAHTNALQAAAEQTTDAGRQVAAQYTEVLPNLSGARDAVYQLGNMAVQELRGMLPSDAPTFGDPVA